ncbi:MAG: T9SS type A sorting domain-containing protein [Flavobacteriales bacterium]|nr:T9SS type A sorting domain-containing protein [Flavobacteriales bacterium]
MNRRFTTFLGLLAAFGVQAQDYLANDPVWRVQSICAVPVPCIAIDNYSYHTAGDSVIAGINWTKITRQGTISYMWQSLPPVPQSCEGSTSYGPEFYPVQLIRQEGRQMHIWDGSSDQLLYDFDLQVGDTLPISWNNWNEEITVIAVDSVLVGSEMRARYEMGNSWAQYLIEGIGTDHGLFEPISIAFDCGYSLGCFGLGNMSYYPLPATGSCEGSMRIDDHAPRVPISVAPVPATDRLTLRGSQSREHYTIIDPWGRAVLRGETRQSETEIDLSTLSNGMYSLVIGRSALRVIVMK